MTDYDATASPTLSRTAADLHRLLDRGNRLTKQEAARRLGRHERSITRLVDELRQAGVPVREEKDPRNRRAKRFYLAEEHQRRGLVLDALDEHALFALSVAAEAAGAALAGTPLEAPLRRGFHALLAAVSDLPDEEGEPAGPFTFEPDAVPTSWYFGALAAEPPDPDIYAALNRAIGSCQAVRIDYTDGEGERTYGRELEPLALAPIGGVWRLVAHCKLRGALREFNLVRIAHLKPVSRYFARPDGFSLRAHFAGRFGALEGGEPVEVILRVAPERATYFRSRRYHPSQQIEERGGGALGVTYRVPGGKALDEVRAWVRSWGPYVLVEAPADLAEQIAADAADTARAYEDRP